MYCSHFGLHRPPFNNTPDPSFYYSTPDHEEALATLQYATLNRKGFVLVSGEVGAGKTLIGRMFIRQIDRQASTAVITHTQLNARQLLAAICAEFELEVPADATNLQLADRLQDYLLDQFARDRFAVVLIDEGQNLPDESFEALRMLGNLEADDAKLLQVCILGQPELRERFKSDSMRQFDQRLFRRFHLAGLTESQTSEYIQRRLTVAGCARSDIFTPAALTRIHCGSQGIPRLINRICDNALLAAYAKGRGVVDEALVLQVLDQEGLRNLESASPPANSNVASRTDQKIEQIYGAAPELIEKQQTPAPDDRLREVREVMTKATQQWPALKDAIERHRIDLQKSVEEAAARCRNAEQQIETVARTAVPVEALEELRQLHQNQTGRVMEEIAASRSSIQNLVSQTEARLSETETRLREIGTSSATVDSVTRLQQRQDEQLRDALAQVEQHRRHIEELIQLLGTQCQQTQAGVTALIESQNNNQVAWADRFEEKLAEYQNAVSQQVQGAARADEVQALRETQETLQSDWSKRLDQTLAELNSGLQAQLCSAATKDELESLRQSQAAAREQLNRDLRESVAEAQARIQKQLQEKASADQVDLLREAQHQSRADLEQKLTAIRDSLDSELSTTVRRGELDELRQSTASLALVRDIEAKAFQTQTSLAEHQVQTAELVTDHEAAIQDIYTSVGRHEDEIRQLSHQASSRLETLARELGELKSGTFGQQDIERLRVDHQAFVREVLERFERKAIELDELKTAVDEQLVRSADDQQSSMAQLTDRIDAEIGQLRESWQKLVEGHAAIQQKLASLDEQYASRAELDAIRQTQSAQSDQMLEQIQTSRQAMQSLIDELADRFRTTHQRLDALTTASQGQGGELVELRRTQAEDVASLLRQLEDQRRLSQEQFEQLLTYWNQSRDELNSLRASAADAAALEELSQTEARRSEEILGVIAEQRQTLENLIHAADERCDVMLARLDALPANVASTQDVQSLQEESRNNKAALENAIRSVADQCDHTASALRSLQDHAASVDSHLEQIRHDHAQNLDEILQRLDGQTTEYQQEFDALNQRWTGLRTELQKVAGSAMPVAKFEAAERLIGRDMNALKARLDQVAERRQKDVRVLVDVVQRLNDRVKQLEEMDRPAPVRVELRPRAAEELAELNTAAENKAAELRTLLGQMNAVSDQLLDSKTNVEQVMAAWTEQSTRVKEQSEQLRVSATASAGILQAMRKCHDAIDSKLKSPAWHGQVRRGEELTARLEQVLPHYQEFEGMVNTWVDQRKDADALVAHLERLLAEAHRATARLGRVGAMLAGVAGKNTIADTVEAARRHDEQARPTRGTVRKTNQGKAVETVTWPQYRSHMKANAG